MGPGAAGIHSTDERLILPKCPRGNVLSIKNVTAAWPTGKDKLSDTIGES